MIFVLELQFYISIGVGVGGMADFPDDSVSGLNGKRKPWINYDPKAELKFWNDVHNWNSTWNRDSGFGLEVDYVKVWTI